MKMPHIAGIALFCGAMGAVGGQNVQAASSSPASFVRMLLQRESNLIFNDRIAIATQNRGIRNILLLKTDTQTTRVRRMLAQLDRQILGLQATINKTTGKLQGLDGQVMATLPSIPTPNPFTSLAASNSAVIATLVARPPFNGIPPASLFQ
jgi:hypothetical protein